MRRTAVVFIGIAAGVSLLGAIVGREGSPQPLAGVYAVNEATSTGDGYVLGHEMRRLDGDVELLGKYEGRVLLLVNVASKCGNTPQYEGLQSLYETYHERGFEVLGFPANNFLGQEPGSDAEIAEFCKQNYGVTFPMFSKISVKGEDMHPLYTQLTTQPEPIGGEVRWNFQKYLIDRDGNVVKKFDPAVTLRLSNTAHLTLEEIDMTTQPTHILLTQSFSFAAAHRLHIDSLTDEENRSLFGKCNNPNGHGHNYTLDVTVRTTMTDPPPCTFEQLESIVARTILDRYDHKPLNLDTQDFTNTNPSVEHITQQCYNLLDNALTNQLPDTTLHTVRVWETQKTCATLSALTPTPLSS